MLQPPEFQQAESTKSHRRRRKVHRAVVPVYRVGELYRRGCRMWPEGVQFQFGPAGAALTLFQAEIRQDQVDEMRWGPAEFALIVERPLIVLAYRFGRTIPWGDTPYSWHLEQDEPLEVPPVVSSPEARSLLWITLVGAEDGIIHLQRGMTLSPSFTRALHEAIRAQAMSPWDSNDYARAISSLYLTYPEIDDRLLTAQARTLGNT